MTERQYLSREAILGRTERRTVDVLVPEWGGTHVRLREITAGERADYLDAVEKSGFKDANVRLVVLCVVDEQGRRLFSEEDLDALKRLGSAPMTRLYDEAAKLNGMRRADLEAALGNFEHDRNGASSSGS